MIELKCKNCNSNDLEYEKGLFICRSCGSKFIPEQGEVEPFNKEDELVEKLLEIHEKMDKIPAADERHLDEWLEMFEKEGKLVEKILNINPDNPYALTIGMLREIQKGINESSSKRIVDMTERAIKNADEDELDDIEEALARNFSYHLEDIFSYRPDLRKRIESLDDYFAEKVWGYSKYKDYDKPRQRPKTVSERLAEIDKPLYSSSSFSQNIDDACHRQEKRKKYEKGKEFIAAGFVGIGADVAWCLSCLKHGGYIPFGEMFLFHVFCIGGGIICLLIGKSMMDENK